MQCSTDANNGEACRDLLVARGSASLDLTTSHHQEGGAGLSPGSAHSEQTKQRWVQGSYLLLSLHFPATEDFQNSLSLKQYRKCLSSQILCEFLKYLPVFQHHNNSVPLQTFFHVNLLCENEQGSPFNNRKQRHRRTN